jgi:hypothetical protein
VRRAEWRSRSSPSWASPAGGSPRLRGAWCGRLLSTGDLGNGVGAGRGEKALGEMALGEKALGEMALGGAPIATHRSRGPGGRWTRSGGSRRCPRRRRACSQNGYLSSRGGYQNRWHSLVNCDHGDSTTSRFDSPVAAVALRECLWPQHRCAWRAEGGGGRGGRCMQHPQHRALGGVRARTSSPPLGACERLSGAV